MKTLLGVFEDPHEAKHAVDDLVDLNIPKDSISYLASEETVDVKRTSVPAERGLGSAVASGALTGGVVGAVAGLIVAAGVLPGIGALFVAGPIASALGLTGFAATTAAGALTGLAAGGIIGALTEFGVS